MQEQAKQKIILPCKWDAVILLVSAVIAFFLWNHPDIAETAQHTKILLDDLMQGRFFHFYEDTMRAKEVLGYANAAHYHIVFYLLCALWNLPIYLLGYFVSISSFAFLLWTKLLGVAAGVLCGFLLKEIAKAFSFSQEIVAWTPYFFWFSPISFFTVLVMGQYDSLGLLFILLGFLFYQRNQIWPFVLVFGAAFVFKMFAIFLFIPLLLLKEKRISFLLLYGLSSLWLYLPGVLLFSGRDGDAGFFNQLITERLFEAKLPFFSQPSFLLVSLAVLYFLCWIDKTQEQAVLQQKAWNICFFVFALLFLFVQWHPQWLILLVPFFLLTTWQRTQKNQWLLLVLIFSIGYFAMTAYAFPSQLESNLFDGGILAKVWGFTIPQDALVRTNTVYFELIPYFSQLSKVAFAAPLVLQMLAFFPFQTKNILEDSSKEQAENISLRGWCYAIFLCSFVIFWLVPSLFAWLKMMQLL